MYNAPTLTQRIGQAEKALQSILNRILAETGINFIQWVTMTFLARQGTVVQKNSLVEQVSSALKSDAQTVFTMLDSLMSHGLLGASLESPGGISLTEEGVRQFQDIRQRIEHVTQGLYGDLQANDLAATDRVLAVITERANAKLAHMG